MFVDKSSKRVPMRYLQFLRDLKECSTYAWGVFLLSTLNVKLLSIYLMLLLVFSAFICVYFTYLWLDQPFICFVRF